MAEREFNTEGANKVEQHYSIAPLYRMNWEEIYNYINKERYFVLHAPRQTGKSSTMLAMMEKLNSEGKYAACYVNVEGMQAARNDVDAAIPAICNAMARSIKLYLGDETPATWFAQHYGKVPPYDMLVDLLAHWAINSDKPTVLLIDEIDALVGDTLISVLRQIRAGYLQRPHAFPQSIILCGVRDVRDYRIHQGNGEIITGGSAFNIKAASLRMENFTDAECRELLLQHTQETGQVFDEAIFPEMWLDTAGQPWLVNALAKEMTWSDKSARDRSVFISLEKYFQARERLIYSRVTHLDQLTSKLDEARVHRVISCLLADEMSADNIPPDDIQYVVDLGLINAHPELHISNRIYQEIIPRELTWSKQVTISNQQQSWYIKPDGSLDMVKLLEAFQQFFRENADSWIERFDYKEAGSQLLMQAFLQRIINGGGRISREYALGRKRTDLLIQWPLDKEQGFLGKVQRVVIELKILRDALDTTITKGLAQTRAYGEHVGAEELHLVIFNRKPEVSWDEKIWFEWQDGIGVWGC